MRASRCPLACPAAQLPPAAPGVIGHRIGTVSMLPSPPPPESRPTRLDSTHTRYRLPGKLSLPVAPVTPPAPLQSVRFSGPPWNHRRVGPIASLNQGRPAPSVTYVSLERLDSGVLAIDRDPQETANRPAGLVSQGVDSLGAQLPGQVRNGNRSVAPPWRRSVHGIPEVKYRLSRYEFMGHSLGRGIIYGVTRQIRTVASGRPRGELD